MMFPLNNSASLEFVDVDASQFQGHDLQHFFSEKTITSNIEFFAL